MGDVKCHYKKTGLKQKLDHKKRKIWLETKSLYSKFDFITLF